MINKSQFKTALEQLRKNSKKRNFNQAVDLVINFKSLDLKKNPVDNFITLPNAFSKKSKLCVVVDDDFIKRNEGKIDKVIGKSELNEWNDNKAVKKLGQIAGVDAIITGSVTPLENSIRMTTKVIATDTANVIGAAKCDIAKTRAIEELLTREIDTSSQSSGSSYVPSISPKSKKVGDLVITMKSVVVASVKEVRVILDIFNQSDEILKIRGRSENVSDEKGNSFRWGGSRGAINSRSGLILNPKSNSTVVFKYKPRLHRDDSIKDIGANFAFTLEYEVYSKRDKSEITQSVSFTDIKAQMPK